MRRSTAKKAARAVEAWNAAHPVGTQVEYRSYPDAAPLGTVTRSAAWVMCDHASVLVEGVSGSVALDALQVQK